MDLSGYMAFYAPEFKSSKPKRRSLDAWRAWKRDVFSTYGYQQVSMKSRRVTVRGDKAKVTFTQVFRSDSKTSAAGYQDTGRKEMELTRQSDGSWLITREDWTKAGG
jgi:ketosteroid isomerase-like protein